MGKKQIFIFLIFCSLSVVAEDSFKDSSKTEADCSNCDKGALSPAVKVSTHLIANIRDKMKDREFIKNISTRLPPDDRTQVAQEEILYLNEGRQQAVMTEKLGKTMSESATQLGKTIRKLNKFEIRNSTTIRIKRNGVDAEYKFK